MNILCVTQGRGLKLFHALAEKLVPPDELGKRAYIVSDSAHYKLEWLSQYPDFEKNNKVLREWDVTKSRAQPIDYKLLARYERELGGPGIFGALFADRRMVMGPFCAFQQDYRRRFSDAELYSILQESLVAIDKLLTEVKPDVICGFICVTPLEYLVSLFARARGIRYINLRTSRIANYFLLSSTINDPPPELLPIYKEYLFGENLNQHEAREHIAKVRAKNIKYEGVVSASERPPVLRTPLSGRCYNLVRTIYQSLRLHDADIHGDNAIAPPIRAEIIKNFIVPLRALCVQLSLKKHYVTPDDLKGKRFIFYPLHTEPELQLLVYSRPFVNQIEVIRAIAMAMPADTVLVVKEHPWMVGKRTSGAYRKMLSIPRVRLSAPEIDTYCYVDTASMIVTLGSSVGLDAAMFGTPVLTLGHCLYNILPDCMVRRVTDLSCLPWTIRDMMKNSKCDDKALEAFVGSVMTLGVPINFYSVLLNKGGVHREQASTFAQDIDLLAKHITGLLDQHPLNAPITDESVPW